MAIGSSSRRKNSRREPTSDIDEDVPPTRMEDDVEDEDEEPRRPTKAVKQEKGKGKRRAAPVEEPEDDEEDDNEDEEEEDTIDVDNFPDQSLDKSNGTTKLKGLANDWESMANTINSSMAAIEGIALALAESTAGNTGEKEIQGLEITLKQLIDVSNEMDMQKKMLLGFAQDVATEDINDMLSRYIDGSKDIKKRYKSMTTRQKYAKNVTYKSFKESLYAVDHPGEAMPPITDFIEEEPGDENADDDDDDDIEVGGVAQDFKCPITLRELENPVTSSVCRHSFSQDALRQLFSNDRGSKKCPASGCNQSFRLSDCQPDRALAQKMRIYAKRQKEKNNVSADEIIG